MSTQDVDSKLKAGYEPPEGHMSSPVIIDIGKQRRKRVRQMRKGRGKLFQEIMHAVESLKAESAVGRDSVPVIVVVREKPSKNSLSLPLPGLAR